MRHFKSFHQDSALLFQFIYYECLTVHRELNSHLTNNQEHTVEKIVSVLIKLTGSGNTPFQFFSWGVEDGILTKLKTNCARFAQVSDLRDRGILHLLADKAWLHCLECYHPNVSIPEHIGQAFQYIERLGEELKKMVEEFREDENVLLFMLQNRAQLDGMYKRKFVKESIEWIFPDGRGLDYMVDRYERRGFSHLIPIIKQLFEVL